MGAMESLESRRMLDGTVDLRDLNHLTSNFGFSAGLDGVVGPEDWAALASAVRLNGQVDWNAFARAQGATPPFAVTRDGTLTVTGTKKVDRIVVDSAVLTQLQLQHPETRIKRVHVDAGAGDDVVEMKIGLPATIVGGKGNDSLTGGGRADLISGGAGDDDVHGGSGNDTLEGLAGSDHLNGHAGADLVLGGADMDIGLFGGSGDDTIHAGAGGGVCRGQDGNDLLYGIGDGEAQLHGGAGRDRFKCRDGDLRGITDFIYTGPPDQGDRVLAMDDNDVVRAGGF
jgi:Ca2+-binding RTX toxin-like protein